MVIPYVTDVHSTMAQEDEKALLDEEVHDLLPTSTRPSERTVDCRQHHHSQRALYLTVVLVGSVILNVVLAVVLLRVKSGYQAQQKSPYGQCIPLRMSDC